MLAAAKINLFLHITGKLHNGYHLLESLMLPIAIGDEVMVKESSQLLLEISGQFADNSWDTEQDITIKAAKALANHANINNPKALIKVIKQTPVGAGLGGGSADAAAVLKLLNGLWGLNYSEQTLAQIGVKLGADIPFCLFNKPAFVWGIGEHIKQVQIPKLNILLVYPMQSLATGSVFQYQAIDFSEQKGYEPTDNFVAYLQKCSNDLELNAISIQPIVSELLELISNQPGCQLSRMSGSGSTCFGIFESSFALENAYKNISDIHPDWWIKKI